MNFSTYLWCGTSTFFSKRERAFKNRKDIKKLFSFLFFILYSSFFKMFLNSPVLFSFSFSYDYSRDMLASPSSIKAVLQFIGLDETGLVRLLSSYFQKIHDFSLLFNSYFFTLKSNFLLWLVSFCACLWF